MEAQVLRPIHARVRKQVPAVVNNRDALRSAHFLCLLNRGVHDETRARQGKKWLLVDEIWHENPPFRSFASINLVSDGERIKVGLSPRLCCSNVVKPGSSPLD